MAAFRFWTFWVSPVSWLLLTLVLLPFFPKFRFLEDLSVLVSCCCHSKSSHTWSFKAAPFIGSRFLWVPRLGTHSAAQLRLCSESHKLKTKALAGWALDCSLGEDPAPQLALVACRLQFLVVVWPGSPASSLAVSRGLVFALGGCLPSSSCFPWAGGSLSR